MDSTPTLEAPMTELTAPLATTSTDRCPNCGTHMAPDQRYCIACGERRSGGGLRDALPRAQTAAPAPAPRRRTWLSPNTSLIAGVATLLLALGVGVLIGRSGDNGAGKAATPQIVTVTAGAAGAAGTAGATTNTTAADTSSASKSSSKSKKKSSASKAKVTGSSSVEATAKQNGVKLPPKVVKVGQKCEKGAKGCQGGKFTGNFFGGG
jgi:zinc-ribbon domain